MSHDESPADEAQSDDPFARPRRKKRRKGWVMPGGEITELNLTPMMDMMTILLVYLLSSYATDPSKINLDDHLRPPESTSDVVLKPAVTVTVTDTEILVDSAQVITLDELARSNNQQHYINPLVDALNSKKEDLQKLESMGGSPFDGSVLIVGNKAMPYNILSSVFYSVGRAGYSQYRLVVMKPAKQ